MTYDELTFEINDKLRRKTFVNNLMNIIDKWHEEKHENNSLTISLEASWGSGKSYLLHMWKNLIRDTTDIDKRYNVVYYNPWKHNDFNDAFLSLIYSIQKLDIYGGTKGEYRGIKRKVTSLLRNSGITILKDGIHNYIDESTVDIIESGINSAIDKKGKSFLNNYEFFLTTKNNFKEKLKSLVPHKGKLIIFIDELDRCKPLYTLETLEIIKHYFDIENIVIVYAVDFGQLSNLVSTLYGENMDPIGYLGRFFDFNISIPRFDMRSYLELTFGEFASSINLTNIVDRMEKICSTLNLSLRDVDKVISYFKVFCSYHRAFINQINDDTPREIVLDDFLEYFFYFIVLKHKLPDIYTLILRSSFVLNQSSTRAYPLLERKYIVSKFIHDFLGLLQSEKIHSRDSDLPEKYGFYNSGYGNLSMSEYIEKMIDMVIKL